MVGDTRQGWALLAAMLVIFVPLTFGASPPSRPAIPRSTALGVDQARVATLQAGGNMEGKEARFGIANSALWATATTAASNGSRQRDARLVHAARRAGADVADAARRGRVRRRRRGLYGMLMFAIVAVFVAGLMVGRTPEYLGKKIEAYEMKMASLVILMPPRRRAGRHGDRVRACRPGTASVAQSRARTASARSSTRSRRPATTTAARSPGSPRTRRSTTRRSASRCWSSRYWLMIPVLAIAGSLAAKTRDRRTRRHAADAHAAVRRAARRRRAAGRRADVRAGARARPDRRAPADDRHEVDP